MTKYNRIAKEHYEDYKRATASELWEVYGRFSRAKINALDYCKSLKFKMNGRNGRIISANTFQFSYGFEYDDPDTGALCFAYITKDYDRFTTV